MIIIVYTGYILANSTLRLIGFLGIDSLIAESLKTNPFIRKVTFENCVMDRYVPNILKNHFFKGL